MTHVTHKFEAWLGGELAPTEVEVLTDHLAACPACADAADQARALWDLLGAAAQPVPADAPSVWDAVRRETLQPEARPGVFGMGRLLGGSLATAAVAAGLILGVALPWSGPFSNGSGGSALAETVDPETYWLTETSWGAAENGYGMTSILFSEEDSSEGTRP